MVVDVCCVVGCNTSKNTNRDLSFHKFPVISKATTKRLIAAVGRRNDRSFRPEKATICSRHFSDECFTPVTGPSLGRRLKKNYLPTLNLSSGTSAQQSITQIEVNSGEDDAMTVPKTAPATTSKGEPHPSTPLHVTATKALSRFSDEEILLELSQRQAAFVCACGMVFQDRALYYMHRSCHNPTDPMKCAFCGFVAVDWLMFHRHFLKHSNSSGK